jgi:hypothetical protein
MTTIDLKKTLKPLYTASAAKPSLIDVPALSTLMVDGVGDPNAPAFQEAVGTLYSVAYTLKFMFKKERAIDYPVMALEGLWSAEDMADFAAERRGRHHEIYMGDPRRAAPEKLKTIIRHPVE